MTKIGRQIKDAREAAGFLGVEGRRRVSLLTGYSESYLAQIERCGSPAEPVARRLSCLFGCSLNLFYVMVADSSARSVVSKGRVPRQRGEAGTVAGVA